MATLVVVTSVSSERGDVSTSSVAIPYPTLKDAHVASERVDRDRHTLPTYLRVDCLVLP